MSRRARSGSLLAAATVLTVSLAVAPSASAQDPACPPNSRNERCDRDAEPGGSGRPGQPGRPAEPGSPSPSAPAPQDPQDPPARPGQPSPPAPVPPPRTADGPTAPRPPTSRPPASGTTPSVEVPAPGTAPAPKPAPPDLGSRRTLRTRVLPGGDGPPRVRVRVIEEGARGVDSGWTVTVHGARPDTDPVVRSRPRTDDARAGVLLTRSSPGHDGYRSLFTVVGQRTSDAYDAVYTGWLPLADAGDPPTTTITVTLFQ